MHDANNRSSVCYKIKAMQITKKALRIWCVVLAIFLIVGTVSFAILSKKISEKQKIERLEAAFEKAVEKEYQDLLSEYNRLVDIVDNWRYSYEFRYKYAVQLNSLLGKTEYNNGACWDTVDGCSRAIKETKDTYKDILRRRAALNVYKEFMGYEE